MDNKLLEELFQLMAIQKAFKALEILSFTESHIVQYFADKYCIQNQDSELYRALYELYESGQKPTIDNMLRLCEEKNIMERHFHTNYISIETPKAFGDDFAAFYSIDKGIKPEALDEMYRFLYNHTTADFDIGIEVHNESGKDIVIKDGENLNLGELSSQIAMFIRIDPDDTPEYKNYGIADIHLTIHEEEE